MSKKQSDKNISEAKFDLVESLIKDYKLELKENHRCITGNLGRCIICDNK